MKVVINKCEGGFGISSLALIELVKRNAKCIESLTPKEYYGGKTHNKKEWEEEWRKDLKYEYIKEENGFLIHIYDFNIYKDNMIYDFNNNDTNIRTDKDLIEVVESLGEKSFGKYSKLKIIEIPDNVSFYIEKQHNGIETIHESHRIWS